MDVEEVLAAVHKKMAGVSGEIAGVLARRRFQRSAVLGWRQRMKEALGLLDKLDGGKQ